jgi:carbamoyl-phosphate synthase large subunit
MTKALCVAVTGLNAVDSPGPGVPVIRALRAAHKDIRIIGLSYDAFEPGVYLPGLVDASYQIPYPSAGSEALFERLAQVCIAEGVDAVIPNFDAELKHFITLGPRLAKLGVRSFLPSQEQLEARDKTVLGKFCRQHGLEAPADLTVNDLKELAIAAVDLHYPLVIKGKYYEAYIAHSWAEAQQYFHKISAKWGLPVIAQEYVAGLELNVAALGDGQGGLVSAVPMRKLVITDKGKAWAGVTLDDPAMIEVARRFVAATQWRGGFELELIRDGRGRLRVLEVNPRFPAWIFLAAAVGHNQPAALLDLALGRPVKAMKAAEPGKLFIRHSWDMVLDIAEFQAFSTLGERFTSEAAHAAAL